MGEKAKSLVNKTESARLSLATLQRNDDSIEEVLETANHVCLYEFQVNANQWKRRDVEGTLFVVKRSSQPRFQLIILNRQSPKNHVEDIVMDRNDFERNGPYVIYKNSKHEVLGIWFYEAKESEKIFKFFQKISLAFGSDQVSLGLPVEAVGAIPSQAKTKTKGNGSAKQRSSQDKAKPSASQGISDLLGILSTEETPRDDSQGTGEKDASKGGSGSGSGQRGAKSGAVGITKAQLKAALLRVVKKDEFIDMLYAEIASTSSR